jgi:hypothetical protein
MNDRSDAKKYKKGKNTLKKQFSTYQESTPIEKTSSDSASILTTYDQDNLNLDQSYTPEESSSSNTFTPTHILITRLNKSVKEAKEAFSNSLAKFRFSKSFSSIEEETSDTKLNSLLESYLDNNISGFSSEADSDTEEMAPTFVFDPREARDAIPTEDGKHENNVCRFIEIVDKIYESIPATADEAHIAAREKLFGIIKSKLEGKAYEAASYCTQTWPTVKAFLRNNLTSPTDIQTLFSKVSSCQQRNDENISDFAQRIRVLGKQLKTAEENIMERQQTGLMSSTKAKLACFINGLINQNIRVICQSQAKEFEDAVDLARQEEARINNMIQRAMTQSDQTKLVSALSKDSQGTNAGHRSRREVFFQNTENGRSRDYDSRHKNDYQNRSPEQPNNCRELVPYPVNRSDSNDSRFSGRHDDRSDSRSPYRSRYERPSGRHVARSPYRNRYEGQSRSPYRRSGDTNFRRQLSNTQFASRSPSNYQRSYGRPQNFQTNLQNFQRNYDQNRNYGQNRQFRGNNGPNRPFRGNFRGRNQGYNEDNFRNNSNFSNQMRNNNSRNNFQGRNSHRVNNTNAEGADRLDRIERMMERLVLERQPARKNSNGLTGESRAMNHQ